MALSRRRGLYTQSPRQSRRNVRSPGERAEGVSLGEACREWDVYHQRLHELELSGQLLGIRIGNRVWYSRAQLTELLGEPKYGPDGPTKIDRPDNGRYEQQGEFDIDVAA
jgi:hypothetical protein